jgi:predicted nucleic acid-binding protein
MVIVDTSAWVEFFRRDGDPHVKLAVKGLLDAYQAALCGPVELEFLGGARPHEVARIRAGFDILPYVRSDDKLWRLAAANYGRLRAAGFNVPWNDILIATLAMRKGLAVYAKDKHFPIMAEVLGVILYQPGYNGMFNPEFE